MTITSWDADAPCTITSINMAADTDDRKDFGRIFTVSGCQLIMRDIVLDGGKNVGTASYHPLICLTDNAVLRMLKGAVLQNAENISPSMCGGGVNIRFGQLYMYEGSMITGCKSRHGGGVEVNSKTKAPTAAVFGMAGGSIENCEADCGGGVYVNIGQFQMLGGKITGNLAAGSVHDAGGGGIYVAGERYTAAVRIAGGEISGNTASSTGGGILVNGGYTLFQTEGGRIEKNSAKTGGGVSMILGTLKLFGGTVTDNTADLYGGGVLGSPDSVINLQGNPQVFNNTANDKEDIFDNMYLDGADDDGYPTSPIRLTGPLTDGVKLGMSRWVCPDDGEHPFRTMIVPYNYAFAQSDLDRLCYDRTTENKELYADNTEKYAFIPYNGEIVMVLAVDVALDRESLSFEGITDPAVQVIAEVTPVNAPENGVTWISSDENVAKVDENGNVTPVSGGRAVVTAQTKSPYHAAASCNVTVGHQLTTKAEHGTNTFTPTESDGYFLSGQQVALYVVPDEEYQLYSLKAYRMDDESAEVVINADNTLIMPNHDVTVEAIFEPIPYPIVYDLDGGALGEGEANPDSYTIESGEITLNNPVKSGYTFVGWTGTGLTEPALIVKIPIGSTGAREYTAVWKEENSGEPTESGSATPPTESSDPTPGGGNTSGGNSGDSPNPPTSTPDESDNSDDTPGDDDNPSRDDSSDTTSSESKPTGEDNSDVTSSDDGNAASSDDSNTTSSESDTSSNVSDHFPSESSPSEDNGNPSTGIAVSLIPLVTAVAVLTAASKRKRNK